MVHDEQLKGAFDGYAGNYSFTGSFEDVREILIQSNLTVGNLETTLSGEDNIFSGYPLFNSPDELAFALKETGFDLLTTANNHCLDRGEYGLRRTLRVLDSLQIRHTGTFADSSEKKFTVVSVNGIEIAFLSYTYGTNGLSLPGNSTCFVNYIDAEKIHADISEAKNEGTNFTVVVLHYGTEYALRPSPGQKSFFDTIVTFGADAVIGMHPHVVQPFEWLDRSDREHASGHAFCAYSLGNFISSQRTVPRDAGIILKLDIVMYFSGKTKISKVSFLPTYVQFKPSGGKYEVLIKDAVKALSLFISGETAEFSPYDTRRITAIAQSLSVHVGSMSEADSCAFDSTQGMFVFPWIN
ncbi:CapA family protein [candidate division WOR-3 bacterium]|nr:CapA family protein [candidate division WOR-3 bacterium]